MKKIFFCLALFVAANLGHAAGLEKLQVDDLYYQTYLKRITHSLAVPLDFFMEDPASATTLLGRTVTTLGFVKPLDGDVFFTQGLLCNTTTPNGVVTDSNTPLQFICKEPVNFKPFEIYQLTGILQKADGKNGAEFLLEAEYAEPQGSACEIVYTPDLASMAAALPRLSWNDAELPLDEIGELIESDPLKAVLPVKLKELVGRQVSFETWIIDAEAAELEAAATGSYYVSQYVISDGMCKCCGIKVKYNFSNIAALKPVQPLPPLVQGGLFMGVLVENDSAEFSRNGLFTITDAVLVRPLNMPTVIFTGAKIPKIDKKDILPALFLKPDKP